MSYLGNGVGRQQVGAGQLGPAAVQYSNLDTSVTGPMSGYKNKIINGDFYYWQRGTSTSVIGYLCDRWSAGGSGSTIVQSLQSFTLGQTSVPGEPMFFHRTVVTSVAGANNYTLLQQKIENVRTMAGQPFTLTFYAKADATKNICVEVVQDVGTGGSPSANVVVATQTTTLTSNWSKVVVSGVLPSLAGKVLGSNGNDNVSVNIWYEAGSSFNSRLLNLGQQSGTFDVAMVQFEVGSVSTQFEYRPRGIELSLCQRYYEAGSQPFLYIAGLTSVTYAYGDVYFKVPKRAAPSIATNNWQYFSSGTNTPWTPTINSANTNMFTYLAQAISNWQGWCNTGSWTANAEL